MKINYVALARMPTGRAHGYAIMKMCEEFASAGAQVELIVPTRTRGIQEDPFTFYRIRRNFTLHRIWATDLAWRFDRSRIAFGVDQITFLLSTQKFRGSVLYTRDYQIALFARSKQVVLEVHSIPKRRFLFLQAVQRAHTIVVITKGLRDALIKRGIPAKKIVVAPDAVDLAEFNLTVDRKVWKQFNIDPSKKIILYTGHFYGWKGGDTLAEAARLLPDDVHVVLIGGVDQELANFKKRYSTERVHIIGIQPRETIPPFLLAADVLVLPNSARPKISSHYTSPLKLFQYMASRVPIVASDVPSIREILTDETSYWFTPDDSKALAKSIRTALENTNEAKIKAAHAYEAAKNYSWEARARNILARTCE